MMAITTSNSIKVKPGRLSEIRNRLLRITHLQAVGQTNQGEERAT
jgi:hypothetical protein